MKRPKPIQGFKKFVIRRRPAISEVLRETTAGGLVYRYNPQNRALEFLLVQDAKNRWTIPKGHVEEGETTKQTAVREIFEETGLKQIKILNWLGKIHFRYRRGTSLVLMVTHIFLVEQTDPREKPTGEAWMNGIAWMPANEALEKIEYEDIGKLILLALKRIRDSK